MFLSLPRTDIIIMILVLFMSQPAVPVVRETCLVL